MNLEFPSDPRKALEASLTALLLGELPDEQARFLRQAIATDPELASTFETLKKTIGLIQQAEAIPAEKPGADLINPTLSDRRREELLRHFKTIQPAQFQEPTRRRFWLMPAAAAAVLMFTLAFLFVGEHKTRHFEGDFAGRELLKGTHERALFVARSDGPGDKALDNLVDQKSNFPQEASQSPAPISSTAPSLAAAVPRDYQTLSGDRSIFLPGEAGLETSATESAEEGKRDLSLSVQQQVVVVGGDARLQSPSTLAVGQGKGGSAGGVVLGDVPQLGRLYRSEFAASNADSLGLQDSSRTLDGYAAIQPLPAAQQSASAIVPPAEIPVLQNQVTQDDEKVAIGKTRALSQGGSEFAQAPLTKGREKQALVETEAPGKTETLSRKLAGKNAATDSNEKEPSTSPNRVALVLAEKDVKKDQDLGAARPEKPAIEPLPELQARDNPFSTFSLNVSDVSFKLAATSLEKGALPDSSIIRSEEFINAFDYHDPEPSAGQPIAFAWERASSPFAQNRDVLRFSIRTAAAGRQAGRPLNLVLLLDNSGSMERADRVRIIHEALRVLASQLRANDTMSVVTFARTARLWVDGIRGDQAGKVADELSTLTPQGGTNLEEAMNLAYETALRHYLANGINRVVLLTDGAANLGDTDAETLRKKVETNRKQGIALDCFGIGWEGYNDDLLENLTRNADGRYGFLNTPEEASSEFAGQLAGALHAAASDVKVQVEFNPNRVISYRQIGYERHQLTKEQFRDNAVNAAAIGASESGNALYVIETNPQGDGPLAIVRVRYRTPGTADYREHEWTVPFTGAAVSLEQASPSMRLATTAGVFSEWLAASPYASQVSVDRLIGYLSGVPAIYGVDSRPQRLEWMMRQAKAISGKQ